VATEQETTFTRLRLNGARFQPAGVPVAVLPELVAYQGLVTEVAKALFFRAHPTRRRVPKGFEERLGLRLTDVESGSAVPVLVRANVDGGDPGLFPNLPGDDEYDRARDLVADMPRVATEREDLPNEFSEVPAQVLTRFGQTLRDGESIQMRTKGSWSAPYTQQVRRHLLLRRQNSYTVSTALVGVLAEVNFELSVFALRTDDGFRVSLPYDQSSFDVIAKAVELKPEKRVQVEGTVVFDQYDRPQRVDPIDAISLIEDEAVQQAYDAARVSLADRAGLVAGWLGNGEGEPVTGRAHSSAGALLESLEDADVPAPRVYPTPEGGVSLEWTAGDRHVVAEVGPQGVLWLHQTDVAANSYDEEDLPADAAARVAVQWLRSRLCSV